MRDLLRNHIKPCFLVGSYNDCVHLVIEFKGIVLGCDVLLSLAMKMFEYKIPARTVFQKEVKIGLWPHNTLEELYRKAARDKTIVFSQQRPKLNRIVHEAPEFLIDVPFMRVNRRAHFLAHADHCQERLGVQKLQDALANRFI